MRQSPLMYSSLCGRLSEVSYYKIHSLLEFQGIYNLSFKLEQNVFNTYSNINFNISKKMPYLVQIFFVETPLWQELQAPEVID